MKIRSDQMEKVNQKNKAWSELCDEFFNSTSTYVIKKPTERMEKLKSQGKIGQRFCSDRTVENGRRSTTKTAQM